MYIGMHMSTCYWICKSRVSVFLRQWALHCGTYCSSAGHSLDDALVDGVGSRSGLCFCDGHFRRCSVPSLDYVLCSFDRHVCEVVGPQRCSFMYKTQGCTSPGKIISVSPTSYVSAPFVRPLADSSTRIHPPALGQVLRSARARF